MHTSNIAMTPKLPTQTWATIVRTKSITTTSADHVTSQRLIVQNVHSSHHLLPQKSLPSNNSQDMDLDINISQHTNKANNIPTPTPKRRRRRKKQHKLNKCHLLSSINHPQYKHLLITGYIKSKYAINSLPSDITNVILQFYDEIIYWTIRDEELNKFKSLKNRQAMYGPKFNINTISFETTLCPCGWKQNQNGSVQFYIELKSLPSYISSITVYYELGCKQTQSFCKKIRTFRKSTDAQSWGTNNMRLSECKNYNTLQFASLVKILNVEYKYSKYSNKISQKIECDKTYVNEWIDYVWKIDKQLLQQFVSCLDGKFFYSPNFGNNCFSFEIAPNGWHQSNRGKLMLYLRLMRLPNKVKKICCDCKFGNEKNKLIASYNYNHTFCYDMHGLQWPLDILTLDALKGLNGLRFDVKIRIIKVIDFNDQQIERDQWPKYGVRTNYNA